jgi:hypothetical protein
MRFTDFLKATVLMSAGAATALGAATAASVSAHDDITAAIVAAVWWVLAGVYGGWLGRRAQVSVQIAGLLAGARSSPVLPELRPGLVLVNRLWPLGLFAVVAGGLAVVAPQVSAIATGFAIIGALAWRRQERAVAAIEDRDGVRFYVERTSPVRAIQLVRTPGFTSIFPSSNGSGKSDAVLRP